MKNVTKIEVLSIGDLKPYEKNPRRNDEAVQYVANSIKEFGFKAPIIIDAENVIVAGHTRYKAAKELGMKEVPCVRADDLTDEQVKAYRLADNKTAEMAGWDYDILSDELAELPEIDMEQFGFLAEENEDEETTQLVEKPEVEFAEVLNEENNYIVLKFTNDVDWLNALSVFNLKTTKCRSTRNDGKLTENMTRYGVGRVIDGAKAINKLLENR